MKHVVLFFISFYQQVFPVRGNCRFYPTCSMYTKEAIEEYGVLTGLLMGLKRISRCQPLGNFGVNFLQKGNR